jgi:hypothetical protein
MPTGNLFNTLLIYSVLPDANVWDEKVWGYTSQDGTAGPGIRVKGYDSMDGYPCYASRARVNPRSRACGIMRGECDRVVLREDFGWGLGSVGGWGGIVGLCLFIEGLTH